MMSFPCPRILLVIVPALVCALQAQTPEQTEFFEKKIRPVLAQNCQGCHNAKLKSAALDLSTAGGFYAGGQTGPVFELDKPGNSRILKVIRYDESLKMPPIGQAEAGGDCGPDRMGAHGRALAGTRS